MSVGPIPPPFPNGKGTSRLMILLIFQGSALFQEALASPPCGTSYPKRSGVVDRRGVWWNVHGFDIFSCPSLSVSSELIAHSYRKQRTPANSLLGRNSTSSQDSRFY